MQLGEQLSTKEVGCERPGQQGYRRILGTQQRATRCSRYLGRIGAVCRDGHSL